ncbi:hypothetical protein M0C34_16060 [Agarivorans sp. TSD2052]|uniref:hypothetical protein n=1 Tax=Agarivorans sp. TSD2052 TaxID=2937286 RepID=UPI00200D97B5|nr:hypothetical protein [Agarivorans sp. TSD2052]UPW17739.1 hypothetical protein M0C34_16060 [Agarivorans sp. TSD2052]
MKTYNAYTITQIFHKVAWAALIIAAPIVVAPVMANDSEHTELAETNQQRDVFKTLNIPEKLPGFALSSLGQSANFIEHLDKTYTVGDKVKKSEVFLVTSEDVKGNIKLSIKYDPSKLDGRKKVLKDLEDLALTEYKLRQHASIYDRDSVKHTVNKLGQDVVRFNYSKYALPQDIAYFRFMKVDMFLQHGQVQKMVISNTQSFKHPYGKVEKYRQEIQFNQLDNGQYVIKKKEVKASGVCKGKPCELNMLITPVAFYHDDLGAVVEQEQMFTELNHPDIRESEVKLHRVFPIMGDFVKRKGIDTPLPYGISVAYRNQDMNVDFSSFSVFNIPHEILDSIFDPEKSHAEVSTESYTLRGDVYILPFWNVFGLVGKVNVDADVDAHFNGIDQCLGVVIGDKCLGEQINVPEFNFTVPLHLEYDLYGVGTTLAVGYKEFFASLTGTYTVTQLVGGSGDSGSLVTAQPMLGYQLQQYRTQFFIGAEYQGYSNSMTGTVMIGDTEMDYDVGVDINQWAYLIGFNKEIGKHYNLTGIISKGEDRTAATLNFSYRF